jgi:hypothetical protein
MASGMLFGRSHASLSKFRIVRPISSSKYIKMVPTTLVELEPYHAACFTPQARRGTDCSDKTLASSFAKPAPGANCTVQIAWLGPSNEHFARWLEVQAELCDPWCEGKMLLIIPLSLPSGRGTTPALDGPSSKSAGACRLFRVNQPCVIARYSTTSTLSSATRKKKHGRQVSESNEQTGQPETDEGSCRAAAETAGHYCKASAWRQKVLTLSARSMSPGGYRAGLSGIIAELARKHRFTVKQRRDSSA